MRILVTGTAGFIGNAVALRLLERGDDVAGLDNVNPYYDPRLKEARLKRLTGHPGFEEARISLEDEEAVAALFDRFRPRRVVHMAAQAGVRYSVENPSAYIGSNVTGFMRILEGCRAQGVEHLVYGSSSSVYGGNTRKPYSVHHNVDHPLSLYAATKKANELMAHTYAHLFQLPATGLRLFTVYGPWGRPDMALFKFTKAILARTPIPVFNHGKMKRDFTYIDDISDGIVKVLDRIPAPCPSWDGDAPDPGSSRAPYRLYNIGNNHPVELERMIQVLEERLDMKAERELLPMQPGDVPETYADVTDLEQAIGFKPSTSIETGIDRFVTWYESYHAP